MTQGTIHFIYVEGDSISTPYAITNELANRLRRSYAVRTYDWLSTETITPNEGDILLGHPHPDRTTIFWNSYTHPAWRRRIILCPFAHGLPKYIAWLDPLVMECDQYLAICAKYWTDTIDRSLCSHWAPRIEQIDLAINRNHYPLLKRSWNVPGARRFLHIGRIADYKGTDVLMELAEANPGLRIGWIGGGGNLASARIESHGPQDFSTSDAQALVGRYDFLLHCGRSDANPTTILEAAAWGLVPVCTPQSGYYQDDWIVSIPLDDRLEASRILHHLNTTPSSDLDRLQRLGQEALARHYHWDRFAEQVLAAIASPSRAVHSAPAPAADSPPGLAAHLTRTTENRRALLRIAQRESLLMWSRHYWHFVGRKLRGIARRIRVLTGRRRVSV